MANNTYKNFAFISYSHKDIKQAERLDNFLLEFRLPTSVKKKHPNLRDTFQEIFRDNTGMGATTDLSAEIKRQLDQSEYLIVVCSPNAVDSDWVNEEIEYFKSRRGLGNIFPFVVDGIVNARTPYESKECIPRALRPYNGRAANISTFSFEHAIIEILATILKIEVDEIWQRHVRLEEERKQKLKEQNDRLLIAQSHFLAEKANYLTMQGDSYTARLLALEALPIKDPKRPFVPEAEAALRCANRLHPGLSLATIHSGTNYDVNCVSFSPNGKLIAAGVTRQIKIWKVLNGTLLVEFPENESAIYTLSYSPNGNQIAFGDHSGYVGIWEISSRTLLIKEKVGDWINSISYNPNGQQIAICSKNRVYVWDTNTYSLCLPIIEHEGYVYSVSYSQDGKYLLTSSEDKTAKVWDSLTGCLLRNFKDGHSEALECASFSHDGKRVLTGSNDHTAIIWDVESESVLQILPHDFCVESAVFQKDGLHIITADKNVKVWDLTTSKFDCYDYPVNNKDSIDLSPDGIYVAVASKWNIRIIQLYQESSPIVCLTGDTHLRRGFASFSPDGKKIVSIDNNYGRMQIWDAHNGILLKSIFTEHKKNIQTIFYSPNGKHIITSSYDGLIKIWDAHSFSFLFEIKGEYLNERSAVFSPNNEFILTASGKTPKIWDKEQKCIKVLGKGTNIDINSAYYDTVGKNVVAAYSDGTIKIWNVDTEKCVKTFGDRNGHRGPINTAAYNHSENLIVSASSDSTIKLWDVKTGDCLKTLEGHHNAVETAFFNQKGNLLISSSIDRTIKIWDVATGVLMETLEGHTGGVSSAFFNRNGDKIVSAAHDGTIRIWNYQTLQAFVSSTKERFKNRQLTNEECKRYYLE